MGTDKDGLFLKHRLAQIVVLVTGFWLLVSVCYAQSISSTALIKNAKQYDGKTVVYQGEIIGDVMVRGDFVWINLFDGENAIGIWLKKAALPKIKHVGGYHRKGDVLEIEGVFHSSCLEHGGDLDMHAGRIQIIQEGYLTPESLNPAKMVWAKIFSLTVLLLLAVMLIQNSIFRWKKR